MPVTDLVVKLPNVTTQVVAIRSNWIIQRNKLYEEAQAVCVKGVNDQSSYSIADGLLAQITKTSNALEKMRKDISDPFSQAAKLIKGAADQAREPLETVKKALQDRMGKFVVEQRKKEEEEKRKAEDEQRKQIEKQEADHAMAVAVGLAEPDSPFVPQVIAPPVEAVQPPVSSATRIQERLVWEVSDPDKVPRELCSIDPVKINAWKTKNEDRIQKMISESESKTVVVHGITFKNEIKPVGKR
jgi:uncharacterized membrane-anchored protein YhcB (DUF1043 family)